MIHQLGDVGAAVVALGFYLAAAVPVRRVGGRLLAAAMPATSVHDWTFRTAVRRAYRSFEKRGWSGRHGLPDALVSAVESGYVRTFELEQVRERPDVTDVGLAAPVLTEAEQEFADGMHAIVEEQRADVEADAAPSTEETWRERELRELAASPLGKWLAFDEQADLAARLALDEAKIGPAFDAYEAGTCPLLDRLDFEVGRSLDRLDAQTSDRLDRFARDVDSGTYRIAPVRMPRQRQAVSA